MKRFITLCCLAIAMHTLTAQVTSIPDPIFEQMLITAGIDSDGVVNAQIATIDALSVTSLVIASQNPGSGAIYHRSYGAGSIYQFREPDS